MRLIERALPLIAVGLLATSCEPTTAPPTDDADLRIAASVAGSGVTDKATGSGVRTGSIRHLQFSANGKADGSVSGQFNLTFEGSGNFRVHAEVTCLRVVGNQAWIGGVNKSSTNPAFVGLESGFLVEDNGEGANAAPDRVSLMFVNLPPGGAALVCAGGTAVDGTLADIDQGNVQVN